MSSQPGHGSDFLSLFAASHGYTAALTMVAGDEKCFYCDCLTRHRLKCCWRRAVCLRHAVCGRCGSEGEFGTDTDLRSNEGFTNTKALSEFVALAAFRNAQESHARAHPGRKSEETKLMDTYAAAEKCVKACKDVPKGDRDNRLVAQALLLQANAAARMPGFGADFLERAHKRALKAARTLGSMISMRKDPGMGNALRILGVIALESGKLCEPCAQDAKLCLREAETWLLRAMSFFRENDLETATVWSAVSYWNMYGVSRMLGLEHVHWLKKAALLQEEVQGKKNSYTRLYARTLSQLLETKDPSRPDVHLSIEEQEQISRSLDCGKAELTCFYSFLTVHGLVL